MAPDVARRITLWRPGTSEMLNNSRPLPFLTALLAATLAVLPSAAHSLTTVLSDSFDQSTLGSAPPPGWLFVQSSGSSGLSATVTAGTPASNQEVTFHDDNGGTAWNATLYRRFSEISSGQVEAQFDVSLGQTSAAFGMRLFDGGTPTSGSSLACALLFEGNTSYASGGGAGKISYQTTGSGTYVVTGASYGQDTWYSVRVVCDLATKKYQLFFGPRGGALSEISPPGGVDFIRNNVGAQVSKIAGITFYSSVKSADGAGDLIIDNVQVAGDVQIVAAATVSEAKTTPLGAFVQIVDKVVTAGTNQMSGPFFYVQDSSGGIRVRSYQTVNQGDRVTALGMLQRASDGGTLVKQNGEKEIAAVTVTPTAGPFALPKPAGMSNRSIGGGPFGPTESDGYPAQPGVYASGDSPNQVPEEGLNNVGRFGYFWGKVVYASQLTRKLYIDDSSGVIDGSDFPEEANPIHGVRVLVGPDVPLAGLQGKFAIIPGVVGCNSAAELGASGNINNVRVIRPVEEPFTDSNASGRWDPGESYTDTNGNGAWDGMVFMDIPGASTPDLRFDVATFCCPCTLESHMCQDQFNALNWPSANGHYLAMGSDAHKDDVSGAGNALAAYYDTLNDNYPTLSGIEKADDIENRLTSYFPSGAPEWVILNEISSSMWQSSQDYRDWVKAVVHRLAVTYAHKVILYSPFQTVSGNSADWQAVSGDAYIAIEAYLSGEEIKNHGFSVSWCESQYSAAKQSYLARGVAAERLFLGEHFAQTLAGTPYGRSGLSLPEWDSAMNARHTAIRNTGFAGFVGYAWAKNAMGAPDSDLIHFEQTYAGATLP